VNRYLLWSLILHLAVVLGGAALAPMRGLIDGRENTPVVITVGLVEMPSQPATRPLLAPHLRAPAPAKDAEVAITPVPELKKEAVKEKEKPKEDEKPKKEGTDESNARKADSVKAALAQADTVSGTSGSISSGAGGDDVWGVEVGPNVNPYHRRGFASIRSNWRNPAVGPMGRKCIVSFRVNRNGELTDIALESSSGSQLFDRSALRAVQVTHSWEQFPRFWKEDEQIIHLEFEYRP
jgi:TonB family protein